MSRPISDIIKVFISRETKSVTEANFGTILLVDEKDDASPPFPGRTKSYGSLAELVTDGYTVGTFVYDSANKIFSQNPAVSTIKVGLKFITTTPDSSWTAAMNAIRNEDSDWYGFTILSTAILDQDEVADWAEAIRDPKVLFFIRTADANVLDDVATTDIAYILKALSYERSSVWYHSAALTNYIDAAAPGERFPKNPGVGTWMFKTLTGIPADSFTNDELDAAMDKNANVIVETAGVTFSREGKVAVGEYLDVIRGLDWLENRIQVRLFTILINLEKLPFTDPGIEAAVGEIRGALNEAVNRGIILDNYTITYPKAADVSPTDKANRILPDITFEITLAGAIHFIDPIQGRASL